ncbi:MAG TPA: nuclear transport factor 2 family protein [Candidatus Deferrimicrobium sp.]|nr:nuclear transport factor 2 family protein [Candidatus Deferrimicrobium sp.]
MADRSNEDVVHQYGQAHAAQDFDALRELRHADWTVEWPQSGERVRGDANARALMDNYPGGLPHVESLRVVGSEDRWVMTPLYTIQRIVGNGDFWWGDGTVSYPDGSTWHLAVLLELRDGRIYRETDYFAEPFEAPAWRAPWVERMG